MDSSHERPADSSASATEPNRRAEAPDVHRASQDASEDRAAGGAMGLVETPDDISYDVSDDTSDSDDASEQVDGMEVEGFEETELDLDQDDDDEEDDADSDSGSPFAVSRLDSNGELIPVAPKRSSNAFDPLLPVPNDPKGPGLAQASALSAYMSQLRHHAPISREEEQELAMRWAEDGDLDAAKLLVLSNLRLVVKIAMEYRRAWTNTLDLIQEGNVGLMEAVQRFDPYQGVKLSSYAVYWIRAYILKYILDNMRSVRLGTTRASRKLFFRLNKEKRELERQGYDVEPRLLAERLEVSEADVVDMEARLARPDQSFDAPLRSDEGDGMTFGDRMRAGGISSEDAVGGNELREVFLAQIRAFSESLSERDRQILDQRILAEEPRTLAELGEEFEVSRERVRQLEAKLINRLRAFMEENMVDFEYYAPDAG